MAMGKLVIVEKLTLTEPEAPIPFHLQSFVVDSGAHI
jgi:hypothetical protein